jgi:hypothetical protein
MQSRRTAWLYRCGIVLILMSGALMGRDTNVAGTWTVSATSGAGTATQTLIIQQDGGKISGTFKGPRQSGAVEGTVNGSTINFHVNAIDSCAVQIRPLRMTQQKCGHSIADSGGLL